MTPPVIAIVGFSNSGKTRVATALVKLLTSRGYCIAAIKHTPHGHQVDRPGSDSALLSAAGAATTVVASPGQVTFFEKTPGDPSLEELVASLGPLYDLVVAEGFKGSAAPKVLIVGQEPLVPPPQNVIAVVTDRPGEYAVPVYSFEGLEALALQVEESFLQVTSEVPPVTLTVDGAPVSLSPFAARALEGVVRGFLRALKGIPSQAKVVRLSIRLGPPPRPPDESR